MLEKPRDGLVGLVEVQLGDGEHRAVAAPKDLGVCQPGTTVGQHSRSAERREGADQRAEVAGDLDRVRHQDQRPSGNGMAAGSHRGNRATDSKPSGLSRSVIRARVFSEMRNDCSARAAACSLRMLASSE